MPFFLQPLSLHSCPEYRWGAKQAKPNTFLFPLVDNISFFFLLLCKWKCLGELCPEHQFSHTASAAKAKPGKFPNPLTYDCSECSFQTYRPSARGQCPVPELLPGSDDAIHLAHHGVIRCFCSGTGSYTCSLYHLFLLGTITYGYHGAMDSSMAPCAYDPKCSTVFAIAQAIWSAPEPTLVPAVRVNYT